MLKVAVNLTPEQLRAMSAASEAAETGDSWRLFACSHMLGVML